jgi:hypothetical protein
MKTQNLPATAGEADFAFKVRQALNEGLEQLPQDTTERLAAARAFAMTRKKKAAAVRVPNFIAQLAGAGSSADGSADASFGRRPWLGKMGLLLPILVLVAGLIGIYQYEAQLRINETADIDALVLSDELPLSAYLDHGFSAFLNKRGE